MADACVAIDGDLVRRASAIRLLTCDVDGVLTDGRLYYTDEGTELKAFSVLDGVGLKRLAGIGVAIAWITGSVSPAVAHRARVLGIAHVVQGVEDKLAPWEALRTALGVSAQACAHIGDDLPDIPLLARCGLAITVPHAPRHVLDVAHYVTRRDGGAGAVRDACDLILAAQGAPERYAISGA